MSLYLSRLALNLRSASVRRDLRDVQQLHRTVMAQFDEGAGNRAAQRVLFRLESGSDTVPRLLIQSAQRPRWTLEERYALHPPETKDIEVALAAIAQGQRLRFRLRANPTKRSSAPERANAPRLPLTSWDDRASWLARKLAGAGARLVDSSLDAASQPRDRGRANGHRVTIWPVRFEGLLIVEDPEALRAAIVTGIGPARAYGNGLLSVAPAR